MLIKTRKNEETYWVKIYIAGSYETVKQLCSEFCYNKGLCVTVTKTCFVYTGGEEFGTEIGLINYPRFPQQSHKIDAIAEELAIFIMDKMYQMSVLILSPEITKWISKKE